MDILDRALATAAAELAPVELEQLLSDLRARYVADPAGLQRYLDRLRAVSALPPTGRNPAARSPGL